MLCTNCSKLLFVNGKKHCVRCQGDVLNNTSVLCDKCSNDTKQCAVCLKKAAQAKRVGGCGCGGKK